MFEDSGLGFPMHYHLIFIVSETLDPASMRTLPSLKTVSKSQVLAHIFQCKIRLDISCAINSHEMPNSFLASTDCCHLLITFANSSKSDQDQKDVWIWIQTDVTLL